MLDDGLQFACIHMEKHHFLQAVSGNPVVLGKYQQVVDSGLAGRYKVLLQLNTAFFPGGGLVDGFEAVLFQCLACFDGISDNP